MWIFLKLQRHNYDIKAGSELVLADTLSRAYLSEGAPTKFPEEVTAPADGEQRDALGMVASSATIALIRAAADDDD